MSVSISTHAYKTFPNGSAAKLDVFYPEGTNPTRPISTVVYFHGGGLTVGDRGTAVPPWLKDWVLKAGYLFISADYRLLPPSTGHDVVQDVQDVLSYIVSTEFGVGSTSVYRVDPASIVVAGSSAGGTCAYLAAMHCTKPKPKAILNIYGMGGDMLTPIYYTEKTEPFYQDTPLLDLTDFAAFIHPASQELETTGSSPTTFGDDVHPPNPRAALYLLYIQMGRFLDYYTGQHDPSLSDSIRVASKSGETQSIDAIITSQHRRLFPQLWLREDANQTWPPTLLVHGTADTVINVAESRHLEGLLREKGVPVELVEFEGQDHVFDHSSDFADRWSGQYGRITAFLANHLA